MPSSFLAIARHAAQRIPDGPPDPVRAHRHVDVADTKVGERIDHRVLDRGPGPDGSPSPTPLRRKGFRSVGVASGTVTNAGSSAALGIA